MIVLDAIVVISFLDEANALHGRSVELLGENEYEPWVMHDITLAEVLAGPAKTGAEATERVWQAIQSLGVISSKSEISSTDIAMLRAQTGLPIPDCLVVLTAEEVDSGNQIMTFDERLADKAMELGYTVLS